MGGACIALLYSYRNNTNALNYWKSILHASRRVSNCLPLYVSFANTIIDEKNFGGEDTLGR